MTCHVIRGKEWKARRIKNTTLRSHCRALGKTFQKSDVEEAAALRVPCLRLCRRLESDAKVLTEPVMGDQAFVTVILRLAAYQDRWIRTPESWEVDHDRGAADQFYDLRRHLLGKYKVPDFYESAWFANGLLRHRERDWYCHVIQGGSLRSAPGMFPSVSRQAFHLMNEAPVCCTLVKALRYGQLRALELPLSVSQHILESEIADDLDNDEVWLPFFMMLGEAAIETEDLDLLIHHVRDELHTVGFVRLKGRPLEDLQRSAHRGLRNQLEVAHKAGYDFTEDDLADRAVRSKLLALASGWWKAMPEVASFQVENRRESWKIEELCTQSDLRKEAGALRHCVATYGPSCRAGKAAIFGLRHRWAENEEWAAVGTLEVEPRSRRIVQARGAWNKSLGDRERQIILRWARESDLVVPGSWQVAERVDHA